MLHFTCRSRCLKILVWIAVITVPFCGRPAMTWGGESPLPEILILNSYHQGEDWSDNELAGILPILKKTYPFLVPSIEHLDTKRFPGPEHLLFIKQYLKNKYQGRRFDLIFVLDNPALNLMSRYRDELFPGVPLVFAGINGYSPDMIKGQEHVAGVIENQDMAGTLNLALKLNPQTKSVLVVHDYTATGLAIMKEMAAVVDQFKGKVAFYYTPDETVDDLVKELKALPSDAVVMVLTYVTDKAGRTLTREESTRLIADASPVPVYAMHETRLGYGIIGGMLLEGTEHGRQAAEMALRILAAKGTGGYAVENSRSRPVFDYRRLVRFKVDRDRLPADSVVVHQPVSLFQQHGILLIPGLIIAGLLFAIIVLLLVSVVRIQKARNEVKKSEDKYRGLFETIADGLILADRESRAFIEVNPAICRMTGYSAEEMTSLGVQDLHPEEDLPSVFDHFARHIRGEDTVAAEIPVKRKDGTVFYADINPVLVQLEGKQLILGVFRDITERKQAQDAIKSTNKLLYTIINTAPVRIFFKDRDLHYLGCNTSFARDAGFERAEDLIGKDDYQLTWKDQADLYRADDLCVIETGVPKLTYDEPQTTPDGKQIWLRTSKVPLRNEANTIIGVLGMYEDITLYKKTEKNLRESEEKFRTVADYIYDWEYWRATDGRLVYVSPSCYRITGYTAEEFSQDPQLLIHIIHPDNRRNFRQHVDDLTQDAVKGDVRKVEFRILSRNGEERVIEHICREVFSRDGKSLGRRVTNRDITERKQAEQERKILDAHLQQAQKMEAIGTLAGGIAHDFNNILGAIIGYAEMAEEDSPAGSMVKNDIEQVLKASLRAKDLVKQILAFSRHTEAERILVQPAVVIKEAIKMLRSSIPTTIDIVQDIDPESGVVLADPTQIHQILVNLCTNAFHAMEETGGTLSISLKKKFLSLDDFSSELHFHPGDFVQLSIADTGSGISPDIRERIFDPYFTTKEVGKGTGMGLAIIHGIVKSYGGFVTCDSQPGKGSVFQVNFPAIVDAAQPEGQALDTIPCGKEHILFIDDEEILAEMGKDLLERLGYRVTVRQNSIEALAIFQREPDTFDLIITDQTMAGMTGFDLARRMLQIRPDLPVILCTGYSSQISKEKAITYGIKGFAMKPLARKDIAALIRKVLDEGR